MNFDFGQFLWGFLAGTIGYWGLRAIKVFLLDPRKRRTGLKPVDELTDEDIKFERISMHTDAVIKGTARTEQEFVPDEYAIKDLAQVISSQTLKLRKIPIAIRMIYCILFHLDRRIKAMEDKYDHR